MGIPKKHSPFNMHFQWLSLLPLALGSAVLPRESEVNYDGHQVYRVHTGGDDKNIFDKLAGLQYEEWGHRKAEFIDVSVPGGDADKLKHMGFNMKMMHGDLGKDIRKEKSWKKYKGKKGKKDDLPSDDWFDSYHAYEDHKAFVEDMHSAFPRNSEMVSTGTSYEGRDMFGLKLFGERRRWGRGWGRHEETKPAIVFHGTVHAREWITTMALEYVTYNLISDYKSSGRKDESDAKAILDNYDVYFFYVVNPDGFVYTQEVNRLWRKNRSPPPPDFFNQSCIGVDVNRNWPYMWSSDEEEGSSTDPCSLVYRGSAPGSTPENMGMTSFLDKVSAEQGIALYIDWHSYGQYILSPWGFSCSQVAENSMELVDLAAGTANEIASVYGTNFTYGPTCQTLYATNGVSLDYAYAVANATYSYAFELRDEGDFGFVLPPEQIRPTGEEMYEGITYMMANLSD